MIFEVVHGCFGYGDGREVLRDLSFRVPEGKILSVLGPNGVGKTTLLRCMMGLLHWKKGRAVSTGKISIISRCGSYGKRSRMCRRQRETR